MATRNYLSLILLAGLAFCLPTMAAPFGVLRAKASVDPVQIPQGGKTEITVATEDGFHKPIGQASIKITIDSGYFETSGETTVLGYTNKEGIFKAVWYTNLKTENGVQTFAVSATKSGYIGEYPLTASARVIVGDDEDMLNQ